MNRNAKLGVAIARTLDAGAPQPLVSAIVTIQHRGRLRRLFHLFAARFLESVVEVRSYPASRHAVKRMHRAKETLDLVRARLHAIGESRTSDQDLLDWAREADLPRIVPVLRRVA